MSSTVLSDCEKDLSGTAFLWLPVVEASVPAITSTFIPTEIRLNFDSITPYNTSDYRFLSRAWNRNACEFSHRHLLIYKETINWEVSVS